MSLHDEVDKVLAAYGIPEKERSVAVNEVIDTVTNYLRQKLFPAQGRKK